MSTTARELLDLMKVRHVMQESGMTSPPPTVVAATKQLIASLEALPPDEEVRIEYTSTPFHAQYIRQNTNEVLAELSERNEP